MNNFIVPVITLISDMGTRDPYLGSVKGAILRQMDAVELVDITHEVRPFDTSDAAFILRHCWRSFPKGTVHIIGVNAQATLERPHRAVTMEGHHFVGADHGIFALLFDRHPDAIFNLNVTTDSDVPTFPMRDVLVKAACHLARGGAASFIGREVADLTPANALRPVIEGNVIKGQISYVDRYGNLITNIDRVLFREVGKSQEFTIEMKRSSHDIRALHDRYDAVRPGEKVALFNAAGLLEIAINQGAPGNGGGASGLFGLAEGDLVRIVFNAP